jgi:hypothetical protein
MFEDKFTKGMIIGHKYIKSREGILNTEWEDMRTIQYVTKTSSEVSTGIIPVLA